MNFLTGVDELDQRILVNLPNADFVAICKTDPRLGRICQQEELWRLRTQKKYPEFISFKEKFPSYQDLFQWLQFQVHNSPHPLPLTYKRIQELYDNL